MDSMLHRKSSFKEAWDTVNSDITVSLLFFCCLQNLYINYAQDILLDMNQTAVESICQFVDRNHDIEEG